MTDNYNWPPDELMPPDDEDEIDAALEAARRETAANPPAPRSEAERAAAWEQIRTDDALEFSEARLAYRFAQQHKASLRYCHGTGAWFTWGGQSWQRDCTGQALAVSIAFCSGMAQMAPLASATRLGSIRTAESILRGATSMPDLTVAAGSWDKDPWLLGGPGGTVNLRTGMVREAAQADGITRHAACAPAETAACPRWLRFLDEATGGDVGLIRFLRAWAGYCLTGDTTEQALLFVFGGGGNGKSVFLNTLAGIMGTYAYRAAADTFAETRGERHPVELAVLDGPRLVVASETESGKGWNESRIKSLTGGEAITARFMGKNPFTFMPVFKITIAGNHQPELKSVDDAARRRFNIVPFLLKPAVKDPRLEEALRSEWPGILRWAIDGCLDWQEHGLVRPESVRRATDDYLEDQDSIQQWIAERCELGEKLTERTRTLFSSWAAWARAAGEVVGTEKTFAQALQKIGYPKKQHIHGVKGTRGFGGIRVSEHEDLPI